MMFRPIAALVLAASLAVPAAAQNTPPSLSQRIIAMRADPDRNGFEMGMLLGLRALEKIAQVQWQHGGTDIAMIGMPRIGGRNYARNYAPEPLSAETVTNALTTLDADMEEARAVLQSALPVPFEMELNTIWLDINSDGQMQEEEQIAKALGPLIVGRNFGRNKADPNGLPNVRFDEADHKWLLAYTHMLSGGANFGLAFDPAPVIAHMRGAMPDLATLPSKPYPWTREELEAEIAVLEAQRSEIEAQQKNLRSKIDPLKKEQRALFDKSRAKDITPEQRKQFQQEAREFREKYLNTLNDETRALSHTSRSLSNEIRAIKGKMPPEPVALNEEKSLRDQLLEQRLRGQSPNRMDTARPIVDSIYILLKSLEQSPDAARLQAAKGHWLRMIAINRQFWLEVEKETDDNAEWIPNANQTPALDLQIDPGASAAWMRVLRDAEAVLQGDLLIPHPLLPEGTGIDLASYIENPAPLDLLGWIQGVSAYPYMAKGPRITAQYWRAFGRMTGGRAGLFAFYFN